MRHLATLLVKSMTLKTRGIGKSSYVLGRLRGVASTSYGVADILVNEPEY